MEVLGAALAVGKSLIASSVGRLAITAVAQYALASLMRPRPERQQLARVPDPEPDPPMRFVYGRVRLQGTRIYSHQANGYFSFVYLLNSRPVAGPENVWLYDRRIEYYLPTGIGAGWQQSITQRDWGAYARQVVEGSLEGVPFDPISHAAGQEPFAWFYVSQGDVYTDRPSGPARLALASNHPVRADIGWDDLAGTAETDRWSGVACLFVRLRVGTNLSDFYTRFPQLPPDNQLQLDGSYSRLWTPTAATQRPTDADAVTAHSAAPPWVALDVLIQPDALGVPIEFIDLQSFITAATGAGMTFDETVSSSAQFGSFRRACNGVLWLDNASEADLLGDVLASDPGARIVRDGARIRYLRGWRAPVATITDFTGSLRVIREGPSGERPTSVSVSYFPPEAGGKPRELPPLKHTASVAIEGDRRPLSITLPMVTDDDLAKAAQLFAAKRARRDRVIEGQLPRIYYGLEAGDVVTVAVPGYDGVLNGTWEIEQLTRLWTSDDAGGLAVTLEVRMRETAASDFNTDQTGYST